MVSVFSENLRVFNAAQFKESVSEAANNNLYFTIGKGTAWDNDTEPRQANSSVGMFNEIYRNMIGAKRIFDSDISHVVERYDWVANTSYVAYDPCVCSLILFNANTQFYVVTDDWNVYKCLSNNNGSLSTVKPSALVTDTTFQTADGYIWKYMYSIPASDQLRFTTDEYIPVKTLTQDDETLQWDVQSSATPGAIDVIKVIDGGSGYTDANTLTISIVGDGNDAAATAQVNTSTNTISSVIVTNPGSGYTYAVITVSDSSANGSGAVLRPQIPPPGGHGSDPLRELGGSKLIINMRLLDDEEGKLPITNEFRQVAIIQDPYIFNTSNVSTNTVVSQYMTLTLNGTSVDYDEDEIVYQGGSLATATFTGTVLEWDSSNSRIKLTNTTGTPTTDLLIGNTSVATRFVDSVTNPDLEPYSGELIYTNNIQPISRAADQTEDFKIVLKF